MLVVLVTVVVVAVVVVVAAVVATVVVVPESVRRTVSENDNIFANVASASTDTS